MYREQSFSRLLPHFHRSPDAIAHLRGDSLHPAIRGSVRFAETPEGVLVMTEVWGLPAAFAESAEGACNHAIFGFHIHEGDACAPTEDDPFGAAGSHYNPESCPHPQHAGDLPPLFGVNGRAFSAFLTRRFTVREIIGRTVILHARPDDFTTQPGGNAGARIACGIIRPR